MKQLLSIVASILLLSCGNNKQQITIKGQNVIAIPIIKDQFKNQLINWTIEQGSGGTVSIANEQMDINDANGCTVWFNKKLQGNIMIEYDAIVVEQGGVNDRVSDLNCFWMAKDTHNSENFFANSGKRNGKFQNYHDMQLYYVGLGGHDNTKTRFRRYAGGGDRPCLPEHDLSDTQYLITANQVNKIRLIVYEGHVQYYRNGQLIYDFVDNAPYTEGYFGIRTYKNHMTVDNFKVYKLTK